MDLVYMMESVGNGKIMPPPNFLEDVPKALHAVFANTFLCVVGIWLAKYNFLLFFYRLGSNIKPFRIFWWTVVAITTALLAVTIGTSEFKCTTSPVEEILTTCTSKHDIAREWRNSIINCTFDIFTDVLSKSLTPDCGSLGNYMLTFVSLKSSYSR